MKNNLPIDLFKLIECFPCNMWLQFGNSKQLILDDHSKTFLGLRLTLDVGFGFFLKSSRYCLQRELLYRIYFFSLDTKARFCDVEAIGNIYLSFTSSFPLRFNGPLIFLFSIHCLSYSQIGSYFTSFCKNCNSKVTEHLDLSMSYSGL